MPRETEGASSEESLLAKFSRVKPQQAVFGEPADEYLYVPLANLENKPTGHHNAQESLVEIEIPWKKATASSQGTKPLGFEEVAEEHPRRRMGLLLPVATIGFLLLAGGAYALTQVSWEGLSTPISSPSVTVSQAAPSAFASKTATANSTVSAATVSPGVVTFASPSKTAATALATSQAQASLDTTYATGVTDSSNRYGYDVSATPTADTTNQYQYQSPQAQPTDTSQLNSSPSETSPSDTSQLSTGQQYTSQYVAPTASAYQYPAATTTAAPTTATTLAPAYTAPTYAPTYANPDYGTVPTAQATY